MSTTTAQPAIPRPESDGRPQAHGRLAQHGRDLLYLVSGLPMGIITFTLIVTGWSLAGGLLITFIGVPIALLTIFVTRWLAQVERARARLVVDEPIPARYRAELPLHREDWSSVRVAWENCRRVVVDRQTGKDALYGLLLLPIGIAGFTIAVTAWSTVIGLITLPAWWWALPGSDRVDLWLVHSDSWVAAAGGSVAGLLLAPLAYLAVRATSAATGSAASALLGTSRKELEQRVERLEHTRAGAVDAARLELERIERDLHDGAQARLVASAISLGLAEQQISAGSSDAAAGHVRDAREEMQRALSELRDLARGIRPALLSERGLREAIISLSARGGGVPVTVDYQVRESLPPAVETAAYFVVAEALANVHKHARASSAGVRVERRGSRLEAEIRDDGCGGADPSSSGLTGLRKRVEALDGTLLISSPAGGPTILRAELPCAS